MNSFQITVHCKELRNKIEHLERDLANYKKELEQHKSIEVNSVMKLREFVAKVNRGSFDSGSTFTLGEPGLETVSFQLSDRALENDDYDFVADSLESDGQAVIAVCLAESTDTLIYLPIDTYVMVEYTAVEER